MLAPINTANTANTTNTTIYSIYDRDGKVIYTSSDAMAIHHYLDIGYSYYNVKDQRGNYYLRYGRLDYDPSQCGLIGCNDYD